MSILHLGWAPTTDEWQAFGTVGTLIVAVFAALYARQQVAEARRARDEQARPYVAVYLDLLKDVEMSMVMLVFKNFGSTTARDITVTVDRPMKRAWGHRSDPEELRLFDRLPALVPGQSWETLFDWGPDRFAAGLREPYTITVRSHDSQGRPLPDETFVIDWTILIPARNVGVKTIHHIGKSVHNIERTIDKWTEGLHGLQVWTRPGETKDREDREWYDARRRAFEAENGGKARPVVEQVDDMESTSANFRLAGQEATLGDDDD